jgi:hypothetical protein
MSIKNIFRELLQPSDKSDAPAGRMTDSFADSLAVELKRAASEAILRQLQQLEGKYLSSILKQSQFPVDSLTFYPLDHATAMEAEEFFRIHAEIEPGFEETFFKSILLKEYRTDLGARAIISEGLVTSIQPSTLGVDNPTADESYQITIRGNKKKFTASAELGMLRQKTRNANPEAETEKPAVIMAAPVAADVAADVGAQVSAQATTQVAAEITASQASLPNTAGIRLNLHVRDAQGERQLNMTTPFTVGRASPDDAYSVMPKLAVQGLYISRHQLTVFELQGQVYAFIPKESKLTGVSGRRGTLRAMQLLEIDAQGVNITFGQPVDSPQTIADASQPDLYPSLQIRLSGQPAQHAGDATPIPALRK